MPLSKHEWMPPSLTQPKNVFGHAPVERWWTLKAVLADGFTRWRGVFRDRDDADAFLWAIAGGTLNQEPSLWRLPIPHYCPDFGEGTRFLFAATILITATGSQARPGDWNNSANTVEGLAGAGSGACGFGQSANRGTGGSGAEYRQLTNYAAPGTLNYTIGAGGTAVFRNTAGISGGVDGADTILDTTALIAKKGLAGTILNAAAPTPPAGGTGGSGGSGNNGGAGGSTAANNDIATGGGGAGGPNGAGVAGTAAVANNSGTAGGNGDNGSGGAGGAGQSSNTNAQTFGGTGGVGTEFADAATGAGGGGGGNCNPNSGASVQPMGGPGGNYGAAGGAANSKNAGNVSATSGAGIQGVIVIVYTPLAGGQVAYRNVDRILTQSSDWSIETRPVYPVKAIPLGLPVNNPPFGREVDRILAQIGNWNYDTVPQYPKKLLQGVRVDNPPPHYAFSLEFIIASWPATGEPYPQWTRKLAPTTVAPPPADNPPVGREVDRILAQAGNWTYDTTPQYTRKLIQPGISSLVLRRNVIQPGVVESWFVAPQYLPMQKKVVQPAAFVRQVRGWLTAVLESWKPQEQQLPPRRFVPIVVTAVKARIFAAIYG